MNRQTPKISTSGIAIVTATPDNIIIIFTYFVIFST